MSVWTVLMHVAEDRAAIGRAVRWFRAAAGHDASRLSSAPGATPALSEEFFIQSMVQLAHRHAAPLLCSNPRVSVLSDKEPVAIDWLLWSALIESGQVNADAVLEGLRRGAFGIVVLDFDPGQPCPASFGIPHWPRAVVASVLENYTPSVAMGRFRTYLPRRPMPVAVTSPLESDRHSTR